MSEPTGHDAYSREDLLGRLTSDSPKRILSLDGGGLRGCITVGFLERIEVILRERHSNPDLRLRDYFDLIGGASTGSLIGGILLTGHSVAELKEIYLNVASKAFSKKKIKFWEAEFQDTPLAEVIESAVGEIELGDPALTTGACIVTKRADTRSTWPLINHPGGQFYEHNRNILLKDAIRASGAAPTVFVPKLLDIGRDGDVPQQGAFVDGGVSLCNNPSFQLFLVATLNGFPFHWQTGEDKLLLTSVGTGMWNERVTIKDIEGANLIDWAKRIPHMLIDDGNWLSQTLLQYLSRSPTPWEIDSEIGDLTGDLLTTDPKLTYLRYNVLLEEKYLDDMDLPHLARRVESLWDMTAEENVDALYEIGCRAADLQIEAGHFSDVFDRPEARGS